MMYGQSRGSDYVVKIEQIPRWSDHELTSRVGGGNSLNADDGVFVDPLSSAATRGLSEVGGNGAQALHSSSPSKFPVDQEINNLLYLWRGAPWPLEVDAVVNTTNESLDEAHSSPGLHAAAGPSLAEECISLGGCRTGEAKMTSGYDLPARHVIHTVGPRYVAKYHTAAENALSHCYRSSLELLIEHGLESIAFGCVYSEAKQYPREPAAHVAIRTVRRFLEKHKDKVTAVVFCLTTSSDTEIYKRLLPLYFPRDAEEEETAKNRLPVDTGDENGETVISERQIRIKALPGAGFPSPTLSWSPSGSEDGASIYGHPAARRIEELEALVDPAFMQMMRDPDQRRKEQWDRAAQAQGGWGVLSWIGVGTAVLSPVEEDLMHGRYLARANALNLNDIADMKILYRGGVDMDGRPVMVVIGAHFLLRGLDPERFVLYVVKEMEAVINRPFTIVYFHSAASLGITPDLGWMKRLQSILGRKHRTNLHSIYILHPTVFLKTAVMALQVLVEPEVWKKVVYIDRLMDLFRSVPREQLTIPDFVFQHDLEVNGEDALGYNPRRRMHRADSREYWGY
eukprot:TRINITY_DN14230_c0_g1_i2.p1 TRINITY_DN14230_c0_g1~~TRINITY_DN14230_c0_g1_i2.p1  ORF type:complete len:568 (-),score=92.07 TRINITY_DN14230_c0_g1_i2:462-2165(-)